MPANPPPWGTLGEKTVRPTAELSPYRFRYVTIPPLLSDEEHTLEVSIGRYGISEPLVILSDGRVVDGQHRLASARKRGLASVPVRVGTFADPFAIECYAVDAAVLHRHLSREQKLMLAEPLLRAWTESNKRRRHATVKHLEAVETTHGPPRNPKGLTATRLAQWLGYKPRTIEQVGTILREGPPELFEHVRNREMSIGKAYQQVVRSRRPSAGSASEVRPARRTLTKTTRPHRAGMPGAVLAAMRELHHQVLGWVHTRRTWPRKEQRRFGELLALLLKEIDAMLEILSDRIRGNPVIPPPPVEVETSDGDLA